MRNDPHRFKLLDAAFRAACQRLGRADLLAGGTFPSAEDFLALETGASQVGPGGHEADEDEASTGLTFVLSRPEPEHVLLGRLDHDVEGEALRLRWVDYCDVRPGQAWAQIANSHQFDETHLRSEGLRALLDEMLRTPEIATLEAELYEPLLSVPVVPRVLEIVSEVTGIPPDAPLRQRLFHDWFDERTDPRRRERVIPIKLNSFQLARYPRYRAFDGSYFDDHSAGPIQLTFWFLPSADGQSLTRLSAMPHFSWWRSNAWEPDGRTNYSCVPDLHVTHRRYFTERDWARTRELLRAWRPLAERLASQLGTKDVQFEDAASVGSYVLHSTPRESAPTVQPHPSTVVVDEPPAGDAHVQARVRSEPPAGCSVLPFSTPVIAFGDWRTARVATLGLNPSPVEFTDRSGRELDGVSRRLETLSSLGARSLGELSGAQVEQVLKSCRTYFQRQPYRRWFDDLEGVLNPLGASYYDGSACHLDLAQWATEPAWGRLQPAARQRLLRDGIPFLLEQLRRSFIHLLLLNGTSVVSAFEEAIGRGLPRAGQELVDGRVRCTFRADWVDGVAVIGWSTNLQSSFGVTNQFRTALAERVRRLEWDFFT